MRYKELHEALPGEPIHISQLEIQKRYEIISSKPIARVKGKYLMFVENPEYDFSTYIAVDEDTNQVCAYVSVEKTKWPKIWQIKQSETYKKGEGIVVNMYWTFMQLGMSIISDNSLTESARYIWGKKLNSIAKIFDKQTGKIYNKPDIGKILDDGTEIINPNIIVDVEEQLNKGIDIIDNMVRFHWLIQGSKTPISKISESRNCPILHEEGED